MPRRQDIQSILIIGAGPIVIGQACEFDYSGTQACKALRDEGFRVILVNSNPATIMTDPETADVTYIEPITPDYVAKVIERERPDAILPTMGGQTALNTVRALVDDGTLERYGCTLIGADYAAINKAEDREQFRRAMERIGLDLPKSATAESLDEAWRVLEMTGLPAIVRPSFTLGGMGGGIAYNREEFERIVRTGLDLSPITQVLIDESVLGWKEYEMEVVRDHADNCIIICSIENIDPMGVHTGDSITVAPAMTLTDKEFQRMRDASIAVLREIGVETGGSNVQFAINPDDGRMVVIEMNPRVSRSSALASKATGFPIAKVAAKLAVGYTLDEIDNDITGSTPAAFEPAIDYVVVKVPRFAFEKFPETDAILTTSMKSVGEAMAMGRSFQEALQKALRSLETGLTGLDEPVIDGIDSKTDGKTDGRRDALLSALGRPTPERLLIIADALRHGVSIADIARVTRFDPWFLDQINGIIEIEHRLGQAGLPGDPKAWIMLKSMGFSDARLATLTGLRENEVRKHRLDAGIRPVFKRVDTCAGEFQATTPFLYSTYETAPVGMAPESEVDPSGCQKIMILGGGPNRIGQGIEFDYCCVHAAYGLSDAGFETIMVNCNPETVSTDPETSDRLYFEPLTIEDVLEIAHAEQQNGTLVGAIVQLGGQTPLKLAAALEEAGIAILGTSVEAIDLAEDRDRFKDLLDRLELRQPENAICYSADEALEKIATLGLPVVLRPSYVLGGRAMRIVRAMSEAAAFAAEAQKVSGEGAILIDRYLENAIEIDVDVVADGVDARVAGVMQHIEEAGIHSGDSACSLPPFDLDDGMIGRIEAIAIKLAGGLKVCGLMNVQMAIKDQEIYILEVNPRASRTVPFVAKAVGAPIAKIAAQVMAGGRLADHPWPAAKPSHIAVKEAVFPFSRFPGVDLLLGPEMKSTGEVMGIDQDFSAAFFKAQLAAGVELPHQGTVFISVRDRDKPMIVSAARELVALGFDLCATTRTAECLSAAGIPVETVLKVSQGRPNIVDAIKDGKIALLFNTTEGQRSINDSFSLRQAALAARLPYYTTVAGAKAVTGALTHRLHKGLEVAPLQSYLQRLH